MKLREVIRPTPKCPRCNKYLARRITVDNRLVFDCPNCQATYEEDNSIINEEGGEGKI